MKKILTGIILLSCLFTLFSQENVQQEEKQEDNKILSEFTVANLEDKVLIVQNAPKNTKQLFFEQAIIFSIEKRALIESYPSYYPLLLSSINSLNNEASDSTDSLLLSIYNNYSDYNIKTAVLKAFSRVKIDDKNIQKIVLDIVTNELNKEENISVDLLIDGLKALENIADISSFDIAFECYKKNISSECSLAAINTLYALSPSYNEKILSIIKTGDLSDKSIVFNIVTSNPNKDKVFTSEIAENLLSETIKIDSEVTNQSTEQVGLQLSSFKVLSNFEWTKATDLVIKYFVLAQKEYEALLITEDEFISIINCMAKFPTTETCKVLTEYLASQYSETLNTGVYNAPILLAVISTLGELGDKDAFDTLLYVISCPDYTDDIISASRAALEKLKWKW